MILLYGPHLPIYDSCITGITKVNLHTQLLLVEMVVGEVFARSHPNYASQVAMIQA
jgi:hypothetical protein